MSKKDVPDVSDKEVVYEQPELEVLMVREPVSVYKTDRIYTYEDYLNWPEEERIELIDGKIYYMSAPTKKHQQLLRDLSLRFGIYLHGKSCDVYFAPFDVRIDLDIGKDSVVQPDLVVICDDEKLDDRGLNGAPDLVIEVLSPSTARLDRLVKNNKYLTVGVKEYWMVDPVKEEVMVNVLREGMYEMTTYKKGDVIKPTVLKDLTIDVTDLFEGYQGDVAPEVERGIEQGIERGIIKGRELGHQEGRELGHQEGREQKSQEVIKNALKMGMPMQDISSLTNIPIDELEALKE